MGNPIHQCSGSRDTSGDSASVPGRWRGFYSVLAPTGLFPVDSDRASSQAPSLGCLDHSDGRLQGHAVCWLIQVLLPRQGQVGKDEDEEEA